MTKAGLQDKPNAGSPASPEPLSMAFFGQTSTWHQNAPSEAQAIKPAPSSPKCSIGTMTAVSSCAVLLQNPGSTNLPEKSVTGSRLHIPQADWQGLHAFLNLFQAFPVSHFLLADSSSSNSFLKLTGSDPTHRLTVSFISHRYRKKGPVKYGHWSPKAYEIPASMEFTIW